MGMEVLSLSGYFSQNVSRRVNAFFTVCFLLCNCIEEQHKKGRIIGKFKPDIIYVDLENNKVDIIDDSGNIDEFLPYISPEQTGRLNRPIDLRSDLYSLGAIFYTLLTGKTPFFAEDLFGWCYAHISIQPEPPSNLNPEIPSVLSDIIMKLMAKSPDDRYQSIAGLRTDLQRCFRQWQDTGTTEAFVLERADVLQRLRFHNRLVERENELKLLKDIFDNVCKGSVEAVFISGYPGVGKTSLVNELENHVAGAGGRIIRGKGERFQRDIPYHGIIQIMRQLIRLILSVNQKKIDGWRDGNNDILDVNGGIVTELVPEIKALTGEFSTGRILSYRESENQFIRFLKSLLQLFSRTTNYPLVVFLDDLQWIDPASVNLIKAIFEDSVEGRLLLIGAYRINEVDEEHPVFNIIRSLEAVQIPVSTIMPNTLSVEGTRELVGNILECQDQDIEVLAKKIYQKSAGNPLCIKQIIQKLYEDGTLYYSSEEWAWKYKGNGLMNIEVKESIIDYVIKRIKKLPAETVEVLKIASGIGTSFSCDVLSSAVDQTTDWVNQVLKPAVGVSIIAEKYRPIFQGGESNSSEIEHSAGDLCIGYEFFHERVRDAVYSLMTDEERKKAHYKIGKALLGKVDRASRTEELPEAVDHINLSRDLVENEEERVRLSELNLLAAKQAKLSGALSVSKKYLETGIQLLPENCWDQYYKLAFELYLEYYWCVFSLEGFSAAESIFRLLSEKARHELDRAEIYDRKAALCTGYNKAEEAVLAGLESLKHLGLTLPAEPGKFFLMKEKISAKLRLMGKRIKAILNLPEIVDQRLKRIIGGLANLMLVVCLNKTRLSSCVLLSMVNLSLKCGNTDYSAFAYACYGIVCSGRFKAYDRIAGYQEIAVRLAENSSDYSVKAKIYYVIAAYLNHWNTHLSKSLNYGEKAYCYASRVGDWVMGAIIQTEMVQIKCMLGESIEEIYRQCQTALEGIKYGMPDSLILLKAINQFLKNLKGETYGSHTFSDDHYDESVMTERVSATKKGFVVHHYCLMKIQSYCLHGYSMEAFDMVLMQFDKLDSIFGKMLYAENIYWACIVCLSVYNRLDNKKRQKAESIINRCKHLLKNWSEACKDNFLHKYYLVLAEESRLKGDVQNAMYFYENAAKLMNNSIFSLDAAVIFELAARFYLEMGFEGNAQVYMAKAYRMYLKFGAMIKANMLCQEFSEMLLGMPEAHIIDVKDKTEKYDETTAISIARTDELADGISRYIDFLMLKKAVDCFTKGADVQDTVVELMDIVMKSSGAQKTCMIILEDETSGTLICKNEGHEDVIFEHIAFDDEISRWFSIRAVLYVLNTGKYLIVNDAVCDSMLGRDLYTVENNVKSVLCLPVFMYGGLSGILYLENNLVTYGFSEKLVEIFEKPASLLINVVKTSKKPLWRKDNSDRVIQPKELLTEKEVNIIKYMGKGLSNMEIAKKMYISEGTVKWHTNHIYKKLKVKNRAQAVLKAKEIGLVHESE
jgi:predicted ATPase/DNA-binding CsgD family transcriptional regulator/GAF domain-containing protein